MIKRLLPSILAAAAAFSVFAVSAATQVSAESVKYKVSMKSPAGDMGTRVMTLKDNQFVFDVNSPGLPLKFVKNKDGEFLVNNSKKLIGKYPAGTSRQSPYTFLPGPNGDVKKFLADQKAKKVGSQKIKKADTDIYTYTEKVTKWKCKLWVDRKTVRPVKLFMTGTKKNDTITATYEYYKPNVPVDEKIFQLPKDFIVRDMPAELNKKS